jgi:formamidopyrimidine-DNA glycosylase
MFDQFGFVIPRVDMATRAKQKITSTRLTFNVEYGARGASVASGRIWSLGTAQPLQGQDLLRTRTRWRALRVLKWWGSADRLNVTARRTVQPWELEQTSDGSETSPAMPELPDITIYLEALERRVVGQKLKQVRIASPFLLRTAVPPLQRVHGRKVIKLRRLGKRIVFGFEDDFWLVLHLMIAGRLHWREVHTANVPGTRSLSPSDGEKASAGRVKGLINIQAAFDFPDGTLVLTEAGTKKRASLHLVQGTDALSAHDPGGLEVPGCTLDAFAQALTSRSHTLKRALTDPRLFSGIGNAYSDEILHRARLSPVALTQKISREEIERLHRATQETLTHWIEFLRRETGDGFPENVTAFRPQMAVHGKFGQPCPVCGTKVQRIRYADNETNYCPRCQTGGKLLADRSLSLLLKKDWPKSLEELEEMQARRVGEIHLSTSTKPRSRSR